MKWILIIYIFTGEHHGPTVIEFENRKYCTEAKDWINNVKYHRHYPGPKSPELKCFKVTD